MQPSTIQLYTMDQYDGLNSLVGSTASSVAVSRLLGTMRHPEFLQDPLAAHLVSEDYYKRTVDQMAEAATDNTLLALKQSDSAVGDGAGGHSDNKPAVDLICLRTRFIDDEIVDVLSQMREAFPDEHLQVVLLGAGLDSRPWRLQGLPPAVWWWEVDTQDVVDAKRERLKMANAQVMPSRVAASTGDGTATGPVDPLLCQVTGLLDMQDSPAFPLLVDNWQAVAADLAQPGWPAALEAASWSSKLPTLWVAEGLVYYLDSEVCSSMLQAAASATLPTTPAILLVSHMNEAMLRNWSAVAAEDSKYEVGSTFKHAVPDSNPGCFLQGTGWLEEQYHTLADMATQYNVDLVRSAADLKYAPQYGSSDYFVVEAVIDVP